MKGNGIVISSMPSDVYIQRSKEKTEALVAGLVLTNAHLFKDDVMKSRDQSIKNLEYTFRFSAISDNKGSYALIPLY